MFDKTVMQFGRWGMQGAAPLFNSHAQTNHNIMEFAHEINGWIKPFEGREHHAKWCASLNHPDAQLIAAAPTMLEALRLAVVALAHASESNETYSAAYASVDAAIRAATFEQEQSK
jgi:hypothetical protein